MVWTFQKKEENGETLYRFYSTVTDKYFTEFLPRNEIIKLLDEESKRKAKLQTIEYYMSFPAGWHDEDINKTSYLPTERKSFFDWHLLVLTKENYEDLVNEKYQEVMREIEK